MLAQKKMKKSKMLGYLGLMAIMLSGTVFFIQKNRALTKPKTAPTVNLPIKKTDLDFINDIDIKSNISNKNNIKSNEDLEEIKRNKIMNLSILSNSKFYELSEVKIKKQKYNIGKKNIFEEIKYE